MHWWKYSSDSWLESLGSYICWMPNPLVQCSPLFLSNQIQLYKPNSTGIAGVILPADAYRPILLLVPWGPGHRARPPNSHPDIGHNGPPQLHPQLTEVSMVARVLFELWLKQFSCFFIRQNVAANMALKCTYMLPIKAYCTTHAAHRKRALLLCLRSLQTVW